MATDKESMAYARECVRLGWTDRRAGNSGSAFRTGERVDSRRDARVRRAGLSPVNQSSVETRPVLNAKGGPPGAALQCLASGCSACAPPPARPIQSGSGREVAPQRCLCDTRRERLWREAPTRCSAESRIEPKPPEREWQASHRPRKTKAEAARILEVIRTDNPDKAATNLKFLVDAGLISDAGRKMLV
jgi:hypothetical protein